MSDINYGIINTGFPVAGQDNDSQGFRDNFTAISAGLSVAKTEITQLQTNAVIVADLATGQDTVENNLQGSGLYNGVYYQLYGKAPGIVNVSSSPVATSVYVVNGPVQRLNLTPVTNLNTIPSDDFSHKIRLEWNSIDPNKYAKMRLIFTCDSETHNVYSVQLTTAGGALNYSTNYPLVASSPGFRIGGESVTNVGVTVAGSGYTTIPTVQFSGATTYGYGTLEPAATVKFKAVAATINNGGTGYAIGDRFVVNSMPSIVLQVTALSDALAGIVQTVDIITAGSYLTPQVGILTTTAINGHGTDASVTLSNGIESVTVTEAGDGYTTVAPTVSIAAPATPGGVQAQAVAYISNSTRDNTKVIDVWTVDGGANIFVDFVNEYYIP